MELIFDVNERKITRIDKNFIVKGKEASVNAKFNFINGEATAEYKAVFYQKGIRHLVKISDGVCKVPFDIIDIPSFKVSILLEDKEETDSVSILVSKTDNIAEMSATEVSQFIFAELSKSSSEITNILEAVNGLGTAVVEVITTVGEMENKVNNILLQINTISETLVVENDIVKFSKPVEVAGTVTATLFNIGE